MRFLALFTALALLPACIIKDGGPTTHYGDQRTQSALRFGVTLDGAACEDVPEVASLHVHIEGDTAPVDLDVACPQSGELIYVPGFFPGDYAWTLSALDANGYLLYESTGTVTVFGGSPLVTADLAPADVNYGLLVFRWSFGALRERCEEVGVRDVQVTIGNASFTMDCAPESTDEGASFDVPPGMYAWSLVARGSEKDVLYAASGSIDIRAGETVNVDTALTARVVPPDPGELTVDWTFAGSHVCAAYEIEYVYVQLWSGSTPQLGDDDLGVKLPCSDQGVTVKPLMPGSYTVDLHGESRQGGRPVITFEALGVPVDVETAMATEVEVDLQAL
jgi:hypothetical protein